MPRRPKVDNPAYRIGVQAAEKFFAEEMARYDRHQAQCAVCVPLPAGSVIPTSSLGHSRMREDGKLCLDGGLVLWPAVRLAAGLASGYYPDHTKTRRRRKPSTPVTSLNTPDSGRVGDTTTPEEDAMSSHAAQAADRLAKDQATRTTSSGATLQAVPEPKLSKGDQARKAARDALPPWQQARYDELVSKDPPTRHVTALAQARMVPEPAPERTELDKNVDDLFAAFKAGKVGAVTPAESLTATVKTETKPAPAPAPVKAAAANPPKPVTQPKPVAAPRPVTQAKPPVPAPASAKATCTVAAVPFDRYAGTVTATGLDEQTNVYRCEHDYGFGKNGHIDPAAAEACAKRMLRNHQGTVGVVTFDRFNGAYTAKADGAKQVLCGCRYGHREQDQAVTCAKGKAAAAGLIA